MGKIIKPLSPAPCPHFVGEGVKTAQPVAQLHEATARVTVQVPQVNVTHFGML